MYDSVYVEYPLPPGYEKYQNNEFQSKDLDNWLVEYHITAEGKLVQRVYDTRDMTPEEIEEDAAFWESIKAKAKKNGNENPPKTLTQSLRDAEGDAEPRQTRADTYTDTDQDHHGDIHFYDWDDTTSTMIDFIARFTHGKVEWIKHVSKEELQVRRYDV